MDSNYPTATIPATPEFVLSVLRDYHRQQCEYDWAVDPDILLTFDSSVAEWRDACDLVGWKQLGRAMNQEWDIHCSDAQWQAVLEPAGQRRLSDVCDLIAQHAREPLIRPARFLGKECMPAGAFLTVRSLLVDAGANSDEICPSTPVAAYTRRYSDIFLGSISHLAPGKLPSVKFRNPIRDGALIVMVIGCACLILGGFGISPWLTIWGVGLYLFGMLTDLAFAYFGRPASVTFGEIRTFRDLSVVLVRAPEANVETMSNHET